MTDEREERWPIEEKKKFRVLWLIPVGFLAGMIAYAVWLAYAY